jgi:hypothetical protein
MPITFKPAPPLPENRRVKLFVSEEERAESSKVFSEPILGVAPLPPNGSKGTILSYGGYVGTLGYDVAFDDFPEKIFECGKEWLIFIEE